ncbi:HNH endonuclease [Rhizobium leguminosarum]|uniref:HNH endonuclease n=1 Tax=Rhizobium leguminosarum TaxID=384 RepID=UPI003F99F92B
MTITSKSVKLLWAGAAGRCSFEVCWERLCQPEADGVNPYTLGEMAHICGDKPGANRYDENQTQAERDDYTNLVLLCPTHHTLIDRPENEEVFTVAKLKAMKTAHEVKVLKRLDVVGKPTAGDIVKGIHTLLEENYQSWKTYGPLSDIARKEPENEAVHAIWVSERLSTIVPNNREISNMLIANRNLFDSVSRKPIAAFLLHARSYESWVNDEIPYSGVLRFPVEFGDWIRGLADGGI